MNNTIVFGISIVALLVACTPRPEPIQYGVDNCDYCRMTIMDKRFGGELVTTKGKVYKFDAIECMDQFYHQSHEKMAIALFIDYSNPGHFIAAKQAYLLQSPQIHSPMGGEKGIAAFSSKDVADSMQKIYGGEIINCPIPIP
ncbi:MAG: nitrous oxide reductase accessory protein NosL [Thermoflavifilum sp.]|nr:nitrous oxide reductase accessory protein NosL [Thermoflavifilum sp.]